MSIGAIGSEAGYYGYGSTRKSLLIQMTKLDDDRLASEYGFNEELLKTLSYVRAEKY